MQDDLASEVATWRTQLRKGAFELAVLVTLDGHRRYGLELVEILNAAHLGISEGSIYPLLARLRTEKKVEAEWVDEGVGHAHKYYSLTTKGRATLKEMRKAWREFSVDLDKLIEGD